MPQPNFPYSCWQGFVAPVNKSKAFQILLCAALLNLLLIFYSVVFALPQNQEVLLLPNQPVERAIAKGEVHRFRVRLEKGQFVRFVLDQNNVDVTLAVSKPNQPPFLDADSPYGNKSIESLSFMAEEAGEYVLEVRALLSNLLSGNYSLQAEGFQPPQADENRHIQAAKLLREGQKITEQRTADAWQQAILKYQEVIQEWQSLRDQQEEIKTLYLMGEAYRKGAQNENAINAYQHSRELAKQTGNSRAEAYAWMQLGFTYLSLDQEKARDSFQQAWELWKTLGDKINEATTLHNLSAAYNILGDWELASGYCKQVITMRKELRDWQGVASTLNLLGTVYDKLGRSQEALKQYEEALTILNQQSNLTLVARRTQAASLNNMGFVYATLGDTTLALDYFLQALPKRREIQDVSGEGSTLLNIGHIYTKIGQPEEGLKYYEQAQKAAKLTQSEWGEAYCLMYSGQALTLMGKVQEALKQYLVALDAFRKANDRQAEASVLNEIAAIFATQGNTTAAREKYENALTIWRSLQDPHGKAATLYGVAQLERSQGNFTAAQERAAEAIKIVEDLRTKVTSQNLRTSYLSSIRDYYDLDIDLLMQLHKSQPTEGFDKVAIQISEQSRSRSLLESLGEVGKEIQQGVAPALLEKARSLSSQIEAKSQKLIALNNGKQQESEIGSAEKELQALISQYKNVEETIRAQSPAYAALTQSQPLSLKEIQQQVLDSDTLLLEYAFGEDRSYLWLVSQTGIESFELPKRAVIEAAAREVYRLVSTRDADSPEIARQFWLEAAKLSHMVLAPVEAKLTDKRLVVVSEGALQYVPFSILPVQSDKLISALSLPNDNTGQPARAASLHPTLLLEKNEIISLPSASVLAVLRKELKLRKQPNKLIAVFADPVYSKNDDRFLGYNARVATNTGQPQNRSLERTSRDFLDSKGRWNLHRLDNSLDEAKAIQSLTTSGEAMIALDFQASRANVINSSLGNYRIIHFATHGLLNSQHPDLSGIVLSLVNEKGEVQDGFLRLNDVYNLKLSADLVVLSACETALGNNIRGEGLVGLTRGFMYAGTARILASLWKVDDQKTAELMRRFYENLLKQKLPASKALRVAQLAMWEQNRKSAPFYWAAFVLQGEWQQPLSKEGSLNKTNEQRRAPRANKF